MSLWFDANTKENGVEKMNKKPLIIIICSIVAVLVATVTAVLVITNNNVKYTITFNSVEVL